MVHYYSYSGTQLSSILTFPSPRTNDIDRLSLNFFTLRGVLKWPAAFKAGFQLKSSLLEIVMKLHSFRSFVYPCSGDLFFYQKWLALFCPSFSLSQMSSVFLWRTKFMIFKFRKTTKRNWNGNKLRRNMDGWGWRRLNWITNDE